MVRIKKAVFDAGPFIHLHEIGRIKLLCLFENVFTSPEVLDECKRMKAVLASIKNIYQKKLLPKSRDFAKYLITRYDVDLGEATGIALCKQESVMFFFTDDLSARKTAQELGFKSHGFDAGTCVRY